MCVHCVKKIQKCSYIWFVNCSRVKSLWDSIFKEMGKFDRNLLVRSEVTILFSRIHQEDGHITNFVCTFVKQFIYKHTQWVFGILTHKLA